MGSNSSSSRSSSSTVTKNSNVSIQHTAPGTSVAVGYTEGDVHIETLDADLAREITEAAFDFAETINASADEQTGQALQFAERTSEVAMDYMFNLTKDKDTPISEMLIQYGAGVVVASVLAWTFARGK